MIYKQLSSVTLILLVIMTCGAVLLLGQPAGTFASRVEVVGGPYELQVTEHGSAGRENMAPGDREESTVTVENQGDEAFAVAVSAVKVGGEDDFFRYLVVTIKEGDEILGEGTMEEMKDLQLGTFDPGEAREYTFLVEFPHAAGNEFQGSEVIMKWVFTATWPAEEGGDAPGGADDEEDDDEDEYRPGGGGTNLPREEEGELVELEEGEIPAAPLELQEEDTGEDELVPIVDEEIPAGPVQLPKTGELPPLLFYGLGLVLVAAGVALGKRAKQEDK